ncbi:LD-carboxypeptidase [[Mycoplasma] anseris]|uniref:LD-carboxypeptidase n=3 Tax=[Mycoplasma] anseris TaxID=92400 RepID=A0A2Z4NDA8_9BACT|nr:LD-carboxypeptidase [[Mycoplasma] anseris]AWX69571.1 LD-carboxypeptidase [[Mycoplasma] anseris]
MILCAIGGEDTYKTVKFILDNPEYVKIIKQNPKIFLGYSDTTINHLMLNKLGLKTYYGQAFLTCIAEWDKEMLTYSKAAFLSLFDNQPKTYTPSSVWYEERKTFGIENLNIPRIAHAETHGFELLQGKSQFEGRLIGGCLETIASLWLNETNDSYQMNKKYHLFDQTCDFKDVVLLLETSEEQKPPSIIKDYLEAIAKSQVFEKVSGIIIGKPQNEKYYDEYKKIYQNFFKKYPHLSVLYNINIGHAYPKMILELNSLIKINYDSKTIETKI